MVPSIVFDKNFIYLVLLEYNERKKKERKTIKNLHFQTYLVQNLKLGSCMLGLHSSFYYHTYYISHFVFVFVYPYPNQPLSNPSIYPTRRDTFS